MWMKHLCRTTAVLAVSAALGLLSVASGVTARGEQPVNETTEVVVSPATVPEPTPADTTTTTIPEETGEIDGVEVAVGSPPIPPIAPPTEVGTVDGVEVGVGTPPVPPTVTTIAARPSGQNVEAPSAERSAASVATSRTDAVEAARQLIESMQTIDILLNAWS